MRMKSKPMFIKTKDQETSETLINEGFKLIDNSNGIWTFVYDDNAPMTFNKDKVVYTNKLVF